MMETEADASSLIALIGGDPLPKRLPRRRGTPPTTADFQPTIRIEEVTP